MSAPQREDYLAKEQERREWLESLKTIRWNPATDGVCTAGAKSADIIGEACHQCGHTNLVHPNDFANPTVTECPICRVIWLAALMAEGQLESPLICGQLPPHGPGSGCRRKPGHDGKHRYGEPR